MTLFVQEQIFKEVERHMLVSVGLPQDDQVEGNDHFTRYMREKYKDLPVKSFDKLMDNAVREVSSILMYQLNTLRVAKEIQ